MFALLTRYDSACESRCVDERAIYRDFGRAVAERRRAIELTQEQVAQAIGLSRASLANIERGNQKVFLHQILALTKALRLDSAHDIVPTKAIEFADERGRSVRLSGARDLSKDQKVMANSVVSSWARSQDRRK